MWVNLERVPIEPSVYSTGGIDQPHSTSTPHLLNQHGESHTHTHTRKKHLMRHPQQRLFDHHRVVPVLLKGSVAIVVCQPLDHRSWRKADRIMAPSSTRPAVSGGSSISVSSYSATTTARLFICTSY